MTNILLFLILSLPLLAFALYLWRKGDFAFIASFWKNASTFLRIITVLLFTSTLLYGSSKTLGSKIDSALKTIPKALAALSTNTFSAIERLTGYTLASVKTNETHNFTIPPNATLAENIARRGAHDDGFWLFDGCTNRLSREGLTQENPVWIHTDGTITVKSPSPGIPVTELPQISTFSNITVYAPLQGSYGFLPGSLWDDFSPSRIWTASTDNNTRIITWEGALLNRLPDTQVSFQAEFYKDGLVTFRYSQIPTNSVTTAIYRNGNVQTINLGTNATSALLAYIGDLGDGTSDLDNDGLTAWEEIKLHQTDPKLKDTDYDGLTDKEEVALATNPTQRDSDNDTLVDGSDPSPHEKTALTDLDSDGLPDAYEKHWFGDIYTYNSLDNYDPRGFTIALDLASGMNPTSPPPSAYISTNNIAAWKITDEFHANLTNNSTLYENTFTISRHGSWEQYFISSKPNAAGEWHLQGIELEWIDSNGIKGSLTQSSPNDSYRLPLSPDSPQTLTIRLRKTSNEVICPQELYLLAYSPTPIIDGIQRISVSNEVWYAAILDENNKTFQVKLDHSTRPSISPLTHEEENAKYTLPNDTLTLTTSTLEVKSPLIQPLPSIDLSNYSAPLLRKTRQSTNEKTDATQSGIKTYLALLDPYLTYGHGHSGSYSSLQYDPDSDTYSEKDTYPLDSECLWKSWHSNADGQFQCDCKPNLNLGVDILPYDNLHTNIILSNETAISTVSIGDETIWTNSATHLTGLGHYDSDYLSNDECDDCTSCESGNCENLEGDELGSLKFRIPLGAPRKGQISGFAWFKSDNPLSINLRTLEVISRSDAHITDIIKNNERTITCHDNRGRTLTIQRIESGIDIIVTDTASGKLEHTWRITNIEDNRIRLKKISRQNNIMSDRTYRYSDDKWTCFDNISQTSEEVIINGSFNDWLQTKEAIIRDAKGKILSHAKTESERIGSYSKAVPREIYHAEKTWNGWKEAFASYYTDNENPNRNGALRLEWGNAREWRFWSYDKDGKVVLTLEQFNGSILPTNDLASVDAAALDNLQKTEWLSELKVKAIANLYDYTPIQGDSSSINDNCKVRKESRYLVDNGRLTLIGNRWMRYIHSVTNGYPIVTTERIMASAQNATIDSPTNQHIIECSYDENAPGLPLILRGKTLYSQDENGILTTYHHSITNGTLYTIQRQSKDSNEYPTCKITETTHPYGNLVRERSVHIDSGVSFDDTHHIYDSKNRLISTRYSDGTFTTNAYSCCRLLWSTDRIGRKTLRSAKTGTDHLYYAEEDVWLIDVSTNGQYRITQHFFDALGRETNSVVFAGSTPGEAVEASASNGKAYSSTSTEYPYGGSEYSIHTDERGKVTISQANILCNAIESTETIVTNGVEVITTKSRTYFGGGSSTRREWDGNKWTEERRFSDYEADGKRIDYVVTESSDCGVVTNSVTTYDLLGRRIVEQNPLNKVKFTYNGNTPQPLKQTTTSSNIVQNIFFLYNKEGEEIGTMRDGITNRTDTTYELDALNRLWLLTKELTHGIATNSYILTRKQLSNLSLDCRSRIYRKDSSGMWHQSIVSLEPNGVEREVSTSSSFGSAVTRKFKGLVVETESSSGNKYSNYDFLGRLTKEFIAKPNELEKPLCAYEYTSFGDIGKVSTYTNHAEVINEFYAYDMLGNRIETTDEYGNTVFRSYDPFGNITTEWGATYPVCYTYDTQNRLTSLATTRDGVTWDVTRWEYDHLTGLCLAKVYPDGTKILYTYTPDGLLLRTTYPSGRWTENIYNAKRELVGTLSNDDTENVIFTKDEFGRVTYEVNNVASVHYFLTDTGIATNEAWTIGNSTALINRTHDNQGRISFNNGMHFTYADDGKTHCLSNDIALVEYLYSPDRLDIGYSISLANGNVFSRSIVRDDFRRSLIRDITSSINDLQVDTLSYGYDALNRPVSRNSDAFGYNERSEVTGAIVSNIAAEYGYDEIGNSTSFTANSLNQYSQFQYDSDGNLLSDGDYSFTYDSHNRLKTVSSNGVGLITNYYDAKSRRVKKVTPDATTVFFYDDWNLIGERIAYTNDTTSTIHYYWGKDLSGSLQGAGGVGGLLYLTVDGVIYIPCYDNNGNITKYIDANGNVVASYTYNAFGKLISKSGAFADLFRHRFSTKYFDIESGLYYYGYRFYHPTLMRWLNRDPIEEDGGLNLYGFCGNRSLCAFDMLGYIAVPDILSIMDSKKWTVGATLMRHWLSFDSNATTTPNETIVKMDWVLGFERAKSVYDKIFSKKQFANKAARKEIVAMIKRTLRGADGTFCSLNRPASQVEADYVNSRRVGSIYDSPDDLMAALGRFNLRMAVSGYVKGNCAFITNVGVYVQDSYDFVKNQILGYWNSRTNYAGKNPLKGDYVSNATFRKYAKATGKGADFIVYSDIKITTLQKAEKVVLSP